jgi:hypothetical protein
MNKQSQVRMTLTIRSAGPAKMTAAILLAACGVGVAACSSSTHTAQPQTTTPAASPANTGPATASQATCKHVNSLRGSLESLTHIPLSATSAGQIRTNLSNVQTQLTALRGHGGAALSHQVSQLSSSLSDVKKAASNLSTPPSAAQVSNVVTALSGLKAQSRTAVAEMNAVCPRT